MIDKEHALPLTRQVKLLQLSRGCVDYVPAPISATDLELMREIDKLHLEHPFAGARMLRDLLKRRGYRVGRRHVGRLMDLMGIEALYRKKRGTKRNPAHPVYPTCSEISSSTGPIRCGVQNFRTSRWLGAFSISSRCWTGIRATCWPGGSRTALQPTSVSMPSRKQARRTVVPRPSTPTKTRSAGYNVYGLTTLSHL